MEVTERTVVHGGSPKVVVLFCGRRRGVAMRHLAAGCMA